MNEGGYMAIQVKERLVFGNLNVLLFTVDGEYDGDNMIAIDNEGNKLWGINDILKIKRPCGFSAVKKTECGTLIVISMADVLYEINVEEKSILRKEYLH